jgi:hypothetical protein
LAGRCVLSIPALHVDRERHADRARDVGGGRDQQAERQGVAVGIAMRPGDARAGRRDRLGAKALDQPGAAGIPGFGEQQDVESLMQLVKGGRAIGSCVHSSLLL